MLLWRPDDARRKNSNLTRFAENYPETRGFAESFDYDALHRWSVANEPLFWSRVWDFCEVVGDKGETILADGDKMPGANWFPQAKLNFAENLLRPRPDDDIALIFRGEDKVRSELRFGELKAQVAALAAYFRAKGLCAGDRVAAYIHNGPEAIIGMLAASSLGAVWSSCAPEFGVDSVLDRFGQIEPKIFIASDGYFYKGKSLDRTENIREIRGKLASVQTTLIVPYIHASANLDGLADGESWPAALDAHAGTALAFERQPFNHPLYIMYSSGTTGAPKCIVHGAGGALLQHMKEHRLHCDFKDGERVFYATSTGWMMWNWLASALACKTTVLLYDGFFTAGENGAILLDYAARERAVLFGTSAGYIKAIEKGGLKPRESHDFSALRLICSTGSPLLPDSFDYVYRDWKEDVQLASISGGTDILSCFVLGNPWGAVHRGEIQGAGLGVAVEVWDEAGKPVVGREGELVCTQSFPSMPIYFWNDPDGKKYFNAYFAEYANIWRHGDFATHTEAGGFLIHGRSDATLNPQGVRIGTADIYNIVEAAPEVLESLAIDQQWDGTTRIVLFVKLRAGFALDDALVARLKRELFEKASPRHVPAVVVAAPDLPRTRSGKLVEIAVRDVVHGRAVKNSGALANPEALAFFADIPALAK
jgi:acetoacetyl-CoA synthetase